MAIYQVFVRLLDGQTQCLQFPSSTLSGETLKRELVARTGLPLGPLLLVSGTLRVCDDTLIAASPDGFFPSLSLLVRLPGGKGGFHSLLRAAGCKNGNKKTSNLDACKDLMSGRRVRHVNSEKKLEEWKAEAEDRRLEKLAEDFLKNKAKEVKTNKSAAAVEEYLKKYREETDKCMEEMEMAVRRSFALLKESKRKIMPLSGPSSKRLKLWIGNREEESESDSDSCDDSADEEEDDGGDEKSSAR